MLTLYPVVYRAGGVYLTPWLWSDLTCDPVVNRWGSWGSFTDGLTRGFNYGFEGLTLGISLHLAKTYNPLYIRLGV